MQISAALAAELAILTDAIDDPAIDVGSILIQLALDARAAVPSFVGLSVVLASIGDQIVLTAFEEPRSAADVTTSLELPVGIDPGAAGQSVSVSFVLYASTPGAFVDLSADLDWLAAGDRGRIALDQHVLFPARESSGLGDLVIVNQAIGVLIGQGLSPEAADAELDANALITGGNRRTAADMVLAGLAC